MIETKKKLTWKSILFLCSVVFIASTLRAPIVAVGPVIPDIVKALSLSPALVSLITTIPLLCFAFGSAFMPKVSKSLGLEYTLLYAIVLLVLGLLIRPLGNIFYLFLGSTFLGLAITTGNVLMPAFIKKVFPNRVGWVTAFYLVSMNLTSALAVGYSIEMGKVFDLGWKSSIGIWVLLSVVAFFFWLPNLKLQPKKRKKNKRVITGLWNSPLAWKISIFMGTQSVIFYVFAAWLPTVLQDWGMTASDSGWMLSYVQMGQVPMMLLGPLLADKMKSQVGMVWGIFITLLSGLLLIIIWETTFILLASILVGIAVGLAFALSTMFFVLRTKNVEEAAELSGMAQSVGYFLAACFPPLFGVLYAATSSWEIPLYTLIGVTFLLLFMGLPASRDRFIQTHITERK